MSKYGTVMSQCNTVMTHTALQCHKWQCADTIGYCDITMGHSDIKKEHCDDSIGHSDIPVLYCDVIISQCEGKMPCYDVSNGHHGDIIGNFHSSML